MVVLIKLINSVVFRIDLIQFRDAWDAQKSIKIQSTRQLLEPDDTARLEGLQARGDNWGELR